MVLAAFRFLSGLGGVCIGLTVAAADAGAPRSAPSRPGGSPKQAPTAAIAPTPSATIPGRKIGPTEHVGLADAAKRLGLKFAWTQRGKTGVLTGAGLKVELEKDSREIAVNGLRVFLGEPVAVVNNQLHVTRADFNRCLAPVLRPGFGVAPKPAPKVIALDAGHGGEDPGMENKALGLKESILTLDVVLRLKKLLEADGYQVILTRTDERALAADKRKDLSLRAEKANRAGADLFVSVHFNSLFPDTKTGGTEVFAYTARGQRSDESWGFGQPDDTKNELMPVNRHDPWSTLLALKVHRALLGELKTADRGFKTKHLWMFQELDCPAVLVESLFLSKEAEARRAATPESRQQIAAALAAGIRDYAATLAGLHPRAKPASKQAPASRRSG